jgi:plasmid maintenance system antidote protein VapI
VQTTLDILSRAVQDAGSSAILARALKVDQSTLAKARERGRVSPTLAGQLAQRLGEDPTRWIALAALEAEPATIAREKLKRVLTKAQLL